MMIRLFKFLFFRKSMAILVFNTIKNKDMIILYLFSFLLGYYFSEITTGLIATFHMYAAKVMEF